MLDYIYELRHGILQRKPFIQATSHSKPEAGQIHGSLLSMILFSFTRNFRYQFSQLHLTCLRTEKHAIITPEIKYKIEGTVEGTMNVTQAVDICLVAVAVARS